MHTFISSQTLLVISQLNVCMAPDLSGELVNMLIAVEMDRAER